MTKPTENELFEQWLKNNYPDYPPPISEIWQARTELADKEIAELQAQINELRYALGIAKYSRSTTAVVDAAHNALTKTTPQCLQEHDNEVIERCAKVCDEYVVSNIPSNKIRALKHTS